MTYSLDRCPELATGSSVLPTLDCLDTVELVTLKANYWNDKWELSIADKKIGTVEKVPSWLTMETFEGNPTHVYDCYPYGLCVTQAEAIGRLFVGWLVEQKIAAPEIWTVERKTTGFDYM
jgi:hypothetical protein